MNNQLPVSMHPRYPAFLEFMADCPYRKTPSTLETAFWAWLKAYESFEPFLEIVSAYLEESGELLNELKGADDEQK